MSMRKTVDLPEPDGPMIVTFSPGETWKSSSLRTTKLPNVFTTLSKTMMGSVI
jgi:hypothetical protein